MTSLYYMNITLQIWNGHKYSIQLREDFTLADFITAVSEAGIRTEDYVFIACGKILHLEDDIQFNCQKRLLANTCITVSPKRTNAWDFVLASIKG